MKPSLDSQLNKISPKLMSCHQPFKHKEDSKDRQEAHQKVLLHQIKEAGMKLQLNSFSQRKNIPKEEDQLV
jgi:hypothetical protein